MCLNDNTGYMHETVQIDVLAAFGCVAGVLCNKIKRKIHKRYTSRFLILLKTSGSGDIGHQSDKPVISKSQTEQVAGREKTSSKFNEAWKELGHSLKAWSRLAHM